MDRIQKVPLILIVINVLIFLAGDFLKVGGVPLNDIFITHGALLLGGASDGFSQEIYRFVTSMFLHADINHLYSNMIALLIFGHYLTRIFGTVRFLFIYFAGGITANVLSVLIYAGLYPDDRIHSLGASGAVYAVIGAFVVGLIATRAGVLRGNLIRSLVLIVGGAFFGGAAGINNTAHIGGLLTGAVVAMIILVIHRIRGRRKLR